MPYPFLSDEWLAEARRIRAEYEGKSVPFPHSVRMNLVVTAVPFGDKDIDAHMDTSTGELILDVGHLETQDLKVTVDYDTAKSRATPRPACRPSWPARSGSKAIWPS
jgi:hypothetical protein